MSDYEKIPSLGSRPIRGFFLVFLKLCSPNLNFVSRDSTAKFLNSSLPIQFLVFKLEIWYRESANIRFVLSLCYALFMRKESQHKYSKLARFFLDVERLDETKQGLQRKTNLAEKINYAAKVLLYIVIVIFLLPIVLVTLGIGGSDFEQAGWILSFLMMPVIGVVVIVVVLSESFKKRPSTREKSDEHITVR